MKAVAVVLAFLLVAAHPGAVGAVMAAEFAVVGLLGWLTWRGLRAAMLPPSWRRAAS